MMWHYADQDVSVGIDYEVDGDFVVPSSATYYVREADGTVLDTGAMPSLATSEAVSVLAANNALGVGNDYEQRFITVLFVYNNQTYQISKSYSIFAFTPLTSTPDHVRRELGLDRSELPDSEIGIPDAYFYLSSVHGATFTAAFTAGGSRAMSANKAVTLQAALDLAVSLPLRSFAMMRNEDAQLQRFNGMDFTELANQLRTKLANELEVAKETSEVTITIFDLSTPTDVITNE